MAFGLTVELKSYFVGSANKVLAKLEDYVDEETLEKSPMGSPLKSRSISYEDVNRLILADSIGRIEKFDNRYTFAKFYGDSIAAETESEALSASLTRLESLSKLEPFAEKTDELEYRRLKKARSENDTYSALIKEQTLKSHADFRKSIVIATKLWELIHSSNIKLEDMRTLGISLTELEKGGLIASLPLLGEGVAYNAYLRQGFNLAIRNEPILFPSPEPSSLTISVTSIQTTQEHLKECCLEIFDALSEIHLHDAIVTTNHGSPQIRVCSFAASLWWCLVEFLNGSKLIRCKVCGKLTLAKNQPGRVPEYCSVACKQRLKRQRQVEQDD